MARVAKGSLSISVVSCKSALLLTKRVRGLRPVLHELNRLSLLPESGNRGIDVKLPEERVRLTAVLELLFRHVE